MEKVKVGFIHGSFDMFSVKDIQAITLAKEECEKLVIGVYSDKMYSKLKGKMPIIPCENRKTIANAIKGVDCVIEIKDEEQLQQLTGGNKLDKYENSTNLAVQIRQELFSAKEETTVKKPYEVGFIQGTFDMFHIGHYNVITKAKEYCEKLIVGVNTDELVRSFKNKTPIIPTEERIMVVESIRGVDQAVSIDHRDKIKAAEMYGFSVLIMGDDWKGSTFYNNELAQQLKKYGVDIVYLPYTKGVSSTELRKKIGRDNNGNIIQSSGGDPR